MKKKLKRYRLKINPEKGSFVDFISQVESPAIEVGFLKFDKLSLKSEINEDKQELFGPVLIPNLPIYRYSETMGEYEIIFKEEDIKEIAMNFMKSGYQNNINLDHSEETADSYVFESFVSSEMIPNPKPFEDLPLGTWFVRMKVDNAEKWKEIKEGKRNGFSIEGIFQYMIEEFEKNFKVENSTTNIVIEEKKIRNMIKDLFKRIFTELSQELDEPSVDLSEWKKVASSDYKVESREVGQKVEVVSADGSLVAAPDGAYEFEDGFKFMVKEGMISEIDDVEPKTEDSPEVEVTVETGKDYKKQLMDTLAEYPWDQCMLDMEKEGYTMEEAQRICGSIKWQNASDEKMANIEKQKEIEFLKQQYYSLSNCVITRDDLESQIKSIKDEFLSVFEKFAKIPAEPSKVNNSQIAKDIEKKKFNEFLNVIRKK